MSSQEHVNAHHELTVEEDEHPAVKKLCEALAQLWVQGDHAQVRDTISACSSRCMRVLWATETRHYLQPENMKDAFDRYMRDVL